MRDSRSLVARCGFVSPGYAYYPVSAMMLNARLRQTRSWPTDQELSLATPALITSDIARG